MTDHRVATANGNTVSLWGHGYDADARRLAAALPRSMPGLLKVEAEVGTAGIVWLDPPDGPHDELRRTAVPDGYSITEVGHFADGMVALTVEADR